MVLHLPMPVLLLIDLIYLVCGSLEDKPILFAEPWLADWLHA
jgi:hypothetical protein